MQHLSRGWKKHSHRRVHIHTHTYTQSCGHNQSADPHYESFIAFYSSTEQSMAFTSNHKSTQLFTHIHMHTAFFIAVMQPRALQCPGVSRPLQLLTGKGSVHQRAVVSKQAAAASPGIRGCMFDVTSRVEVTTLLRPHTAGAYISTCISH